MYQKKYDYDVRGSKWRETTEEKAREAILMWYKDSADETMTKLRSGEIIPIPHESLRWIND